MFFSVYPVCHYFGILLSIVSTAASVDGHLPFLASCHCGWLCLKLLTFYLATWLINSLSFSVTLHSGGVTCRWWTSCYCTLELREMAFGTCIYMHFKACYHISWDTIKPTMHTGASIYLNEMRHLPTEVKTEFEAGNWVVHCSLGLVSGH